MSVRLVSFYSLRLMGGSGRFAVSSTILPFLLGSLLHIGPSLLFLFFFYHRLNIYKYFVSNPNRPCTSRRDSSDDPLLLFYVP